MITFPVFIAVHDRTTLMFTMRNCTERGQSANVNRETNTPVVARGIGELYGVLDALDWRLFLEVRKTQLTTRSNASGFMSLILKAETFRLGCLFDVQA